MKIDLNNYEEFYFGNACESYIQGEFYSIGYEALKTSPDIGYDLLVTNCARTKFLSEEPRQYNIQVKGRVCYKNNVKFYIKNDDLSLIANDPNGYLICVFCYPLLSDGREEITIYRVPDPLTYTHTFEDYFDQRLEKINSISIKYLNEYVPYIGFKKEYLWFNNAQINKLKNQGFFFSYEDNAYLNFHIDDESHKKSPLNNSNDRLYTSDLYGTSGYYAYEQEHVNYLVSSDPDDSNMFIGDIYI